MKDITQANIKTATTIIHRKLKNADGTPVRARRNGQVTEWKSRPGEWVAPFKHGLKECFNLGYAPNSTKRVDQSPSDWAIPENGEEYTKAAA